MYCCRAQEQIIGPPASLITQIDFFTITGGVIIVHARIGDYPDTLNFVLDTGSGGISLDSSLVRQLGLKPEKSNIRVRGVGGIRTAEFIRNMALHFPELTVDSLDFHINDYHFLSMVYGLKIDGVIGFSFFNRFIIRIDYDTDLIDVYSQGPFKYPRGGTMLRPFLNKLPTHHILLKEQHTMFPRVLHDVGAGVCLMLSKEFVEDSVVFKQHKKFRKKEGHGLGGKIDMDITTVKEVKIGPYRFKHVPTLVFDDEYDVTSYPYLGGLIGNDILRRFNVIYDYANKQIYLKPNSHFKDKFDYAYSGLDLLYINGETHIGDVAKGSVAEKVGLLEGDIIIGIDGRINASFQEFKKLLQTPKRKLDVIVSRNGELFVVKLKVESIK
ncbi:aspartyl protease family protein [Olivibacter sitiensis]|uniref:aspartyl protease family protein n=1 Tax=Olivibacter sitiensis TaxID=376470 RepID=UPI001FDF8F10|nr:aspartyl protease family protein [Olivibacter sitiensis]